MPLDVFLGEGALSLAFGDELPHLYQVLGHVFPGQVFLLDDLLVQDIFLLRRNILLVQNLILHQATSPLFTTARTVRTSLPGIGAVSEFSSALLFERTNIIPYFSQRQNQE